MINITTNLLNMINILIPNYNLDLNSLQKLNSLSDFNQSLITELLDSWEWEVENTGLFNTDGYMENIFPYEWLKFIYKTIKILDREQEFNILFRLLYQLFTNYI